MSSGLSRRRFLLQSAEGITAAILLPYTANSAKPLRQARLGVAGLGQRGRVLLSMCGAHGPAPICDINPKALDSAQAAYPGMPAFVSYERMLRESAAEAVAVATPDPAALVEAALASGKHVFLASPRGVTVEAAKRIAASVERSGL